MTGKLRNAPGIHFGGVRHRWVDGHGFTAKATRPSVGAVGFRHHLSTRNRRPFQLHHTLGQLYVHTTQYRQVGSGSKRGLRGVARCWAERGRNSTRRQCLVELSRPRWRFPLAHAMLQRRMVQHRMLQHRADVSETQHGLRQSCNGQGLACSTSSTYLGKCRNPDPGWPESVPLYHRK